MINDENSESVQDKLARFYVKGISVGEDNERKRILNIVETFKDGKYNKTELVDLIKMQG